MKTPVTVKNRAEGRALRQALDDPTVRAFVVTMGTLAALPSDRSRARVLNYVADCFDETHEASAGGSTVRPR